MTKNEEITLSICRLASGGSGIGYYENMAVFVPGTVAGDVAVVRIVSVKKNYCFGKLMRLLTPGPGRIESECGSYPRCGGCVYRHMSYSMEALAKQQSVADVMHRIGGVSLEPCPIVGAVSVDGYRNKAQYPFSQNGKAGFYAGRTHSVIELPHSHCALQPPIFDTVIRLFEQFVADNGLSVYDETTHQGLVRHLYLRLATATNQLMVVPVINGTRLPAAQKLIGLLRGELGDTLAGVVLNCQTEKTNVVLSDKQVLLYGKETIEDILCGVKVELSPLSFYQVNRDMAEKLYEKAAEYACPDGKTVLDLYCGAGTIGLSMAHRAKKIIGVEIVPQAVKNAEHNAALNGIDHASFICADAACAAEKLAEQGVQCDTVIVDPPRRGCDEALLTTIAERFRPERLVYVSCDPATLARDCAFLHTKGYEVQAYTPFDLFPRTAHVETVVCLSRKWAA